MRRPVIASRKSLEYQLVRNQQRGLGRFYTSFGGKDSPGPTAWLPPALTRKNWLLRESKWCLRILSPDCPVKKAMRKMRQNALYIPCMHGKMSLHITDMKLTLCGTLFPSIDGKKFCYCNSLTVRWPSIFSHRCCSKPVIFTSSCYNKIQQLGILYILASRRWQSACRVATTSPLAEWRSSTRASGAPSATTTLGPKRAASSAACSASPAASKPFLRPLSGRAAAPSGWTTSYATGTRAGSPSVPRLPGAPHTSANIWRMSAWSASLKG